MRSLKINELEGGREFFRIKMGWVRNLFSAPLKANGSLLLCSSMRQFFMPKTHRNAPKRARKVVWYDSMQQASTALQRPLSDIKRVKLYAGLEYAKGGRYSEKCGEWIDANPPKPEELPPEYDPLKAVQKEKIQFELELKKGKYILRSEAEAGWTKGLEVIQKIMGAYVDKTVYNQAIREMKRELTAMNL